MISFSLCFFVVSAIFSEFYKGTKVRRAKFNESIFKALYKMVEKNRSRYGGYMFILALCLCLLDLLDMLLIKKKSLVLK